jgi:hypothetical protein
VQVFVGFFVVLPIHVLQEKVSLGEITPVVGRRSGIDRRRIDGSAFSYKMHPKGKS